MYPGHIYIDGVSGVGKTKLVNMLKEAGYHYVHDESILANIVNHQLQNYPNIILSNDVIIRQNDRKIIDNDSNFENSSRIKLNLDGFDNPMIDKQNTAIFIILDANPETILERTKINNPQIQHLLSKYFFLSYRFAIPLVDTNNKTCEQVFDQVMNLVEGRKNYIPEYVYKIVPNNNFFSLEILDSELEEFGVSRIICADANYCVYSETEELDMNIYMCKLRLG